MTKSINLRTGLVISCLAYFSCAFASRVGADSPGGCPSYQRLPLPEIQPEGWILEQLRQDAVDGVAGNFQKFRPQYHTGTWVNKTGCAGSAELVGNWLDGYLRMAHYSGIESAWDKANRFVQEILDAQEPDGYVGNMPKEARYQRLHRDLFNESRTGVALLAYYELTGDRRALDAVVATAELIMANYTPENPPFTYQPGDEGYLEKAPAGEAVDEDFVDEGETKPKRRQLINGHSLMYVDVCEWLHHLTGDRRYVEYAEFLYRDYSGSSDTGPNDIKLPVLLDAEAPFVGHGAHVAEQFRVPFFLACATGADPYRQASRAVFTKLARYLTPSGAMVSDEGIHDQLPLPGAGYEFCATTELATSLVSALEKFGRLDHADHIEWLVFNAAQGARTPDGRKIAYISAATLTRALEQMRLGYPHNSNGRWHYSPAHQVGGSCCTANAVKLLPYYVAGMWMKAGGGSGLAALLLGPSTVRTRIGDVGVVVRQETEYPFSDRVVFHIEPSRPLAFRLEVRIPGWAGEVAVEHGDAAMISQPGKKIFYKTWEPGDTITLDFEHPVQLRDCVNGELAVTRGPLLYALPIPTEKRVLQKSRGGVPEFFEWELLPAEGNPPAGLHLKTPLPQAGFTAVPNPDYDPASPWANPRWFLDGPLLREDGTRVETRLKPLGSTLLRLAAFPPEENP